VELQNVPDQNAWKPTRGVNIKLWNMHMYTTNMV